MLGKDVGLKKDTCQISSVSSCTLHHLQRKSCSKNFKIESGSTNCELH